MNPETLAAAHGAGYGHGLLIGAITGLFIGAVLGVFVAALCVAGRDSSAPDPALAPSRE